jgi:hypothetical protein
MHHVNVNRVPTPLLPQYYRGGFHRMWLLFSEKNIYEKYLSIKKGGTSTAKRNKDFVKMSQITC